MTDDDIRKYGIENFLNKTNEDDKKHLMPLFDYDNEYENEIKDIIPLIINEQQSN